MKLSQLSRISRDGLARFGELPKWLDGFLVPLNNFIENVGLALQNRLTFEDNFLCKVVTQDFTAGVELEINPRLQTQAGLKVTGVIPLSAGSGKFSAFGWTQKPNGNIGVTFDFPVGTQSKCKILILLG